MFTSYAEEMRHASEMLTLHAIDHTLSNGLAGISLTIPDGRPIFNLNHARAVIRDTERQRNPQRADMDPYNDVPELTLAQAKARARHQSACWHCPVVIREYCQATDLHAGYHTLPLLPGSRDCAAELRFHLDHVVYAIVPAGVR